MVTPASNVNWVTMLGDARVLFIGLVDGLEGTLYVNLEMAASCDESY
ncbi:MAG: hypothetical protein ACLP9Y_22595 [Mycobacterium sp.]